MDYNQILCKCNEILTKGWIDEIQEFLPELMLAYDTLELEQIRLSDNYDNRNEELYIEMKKNKDLWLIKKSDRDIEVEAKHPSRIENWNQNVYKVVCRHFDKYIELLESKKIKLLADDKQQRGY